LWAVPKQDCALLPSPQHFTEPLASPMAGVLRTIGEAISDVSRSTARRVRPQLTTLKKLECTACRPSALVGQNELIA
jgi:hypothetical protein